MPLLKVWLLQVGLLREKQLQLMLLLYSSPTAACVSCSPSPFSSRLVGVSCHANEWLGRLILLLLLMKKCLCSRNLTPPPPQLSPELDKPISFLSYTSCIDSEGLQKGGRACVQLRVDNCCLPCLQMQMAVRPPSPPLQPMRGP